MKKTFTALLCTVMFSSLSATAKETNIQELEAPVPVVDESEQSYQNMLHKKFAEIDANGDGIVSVKLNQYVSDTEDVENASTYALAAQMQFLSDMNAEESYFLLLDDPAHFQLDYQALANWDGTPPGDNDYTAAGKTVPWADCPVLAGYDLGTYQTTVLGTTVTGSGAELVNGLFLGRRAFYEEPKNEKAALAREGAQRLWEILTEGATP